MILTLVVATLIVYGLTLLVVQGTIFNGPKLRLYEHIEMLDNSLHPSEEEVLGLIETSHKSISPKLLNLYQELNNKVATTDANHEKFDSLLVMYNEAKSAIEKQIQHYNQTQYITRCRLWCAKKIQKLTSCMMCSGFWIGVYVSLVSLSYHISIFGAPFVILSVNDFGSLLEGLLFMGALFSGTTWAIHAVVDTLDEMKQRLGDIMNKR